MSADPTEGILLISFICFSKNLPRYFGPFQTRWNPASVVSSRCQWCHSYRCEDEKNPKFCWNPIENPGGTLEHIQPLLEAVCAYTDVIILGYGALRAFTVIAFLGSQTDGWSIMMIGIYLLCLSPVHLATALAYYIQAEPLIDVLDLVIQVISSTWVIPTKPQIVLSLRAASSKFPDR